MRILYVAPASFPITSSESIVNAKIAHVLANMGHSVTVYAIDSYDTLYPDSSSSIVQLQHSNLHIRNIKLKSNRSILQRVLNRVKWISVYIKTGYYYKSNHIAYSIMTTVEKDIKQGDVFDLMITRGFYTEMAGIRIAKQYSIPWVANWNDPYPLNNFPPPYGAGPNAPNTRSERKLMNEIQKYALKHTFPSSRLRDYMLSYLTNIEVSDTCVIPHIAHSKFFTPHTHIKHEKLKMIHAGNVAYPRDPSNFLKALSRLIHTPGYSNSIECVFIGQFSANCRKMIYELDLIDIVTLKPSMSYNSIIDIQKQFDLSVIIEAICEEGIYLPTKVADSIQGALPIFCVSPQNGTQHDLLNLYDIGYFSDNTDIDSIYHSLLKAVNDFWTGRLPIISMEKVPYFFEKYAEEQYERLFNEIPISH